MDTPTLLATLALALALVALGVAASGLRQGSSGRARAARAKRGVANLPTDTDGLRREVAALRVEVSDALRHLSVVRYDAFGDMGGHLSWSLALLDDGGNGIVLTSIHGRSEARTYAKSIAGWECEQPLSPEEEEAISYSRSA